jgi:hypothetical protein
MPFDEANAGRLFVEKVKIGSISKLATISQIKQRRSKYA